MFKKSEIKKCIDFLLIIIFTIIAIRKGGYYKIDSMLGIFLLQITFFIYYLFFYGSIKRNNVVNLLLVMLTFSYFIPIVFQNVYTVSGAFNIAIRVACMLYIYIIINNSENKEVYLKTFIFMNIIFGILGIDEIGHRIFEKGLNFIGGGYLENINRVSSVFQYANLLGISCIVAFIYVLDKLEFDSKSIKKIINEIISLFFIIIIFLTESKMAFLLLFFTIIFFAYKKKSIKQVLYMLLMCIIALISINIGNIYLSIVIGIISYLVIRYVLSHILNKNISNMMLVFLNLLLIIVTFNVIKQSEIFYRINEYVNNYESTTSRLTYYNDAIKIWKDNPRNIIFGIGGNGFKTAYEVFQTSEYISLEVHSLFVQVLVETGLLGTISIITLLTYVLVKGKNNKNKFTLIMIIIYMAFDVSLTYTYFLILFTFSLAMIDIKEGRNLKINLILEMTILFITFTINTSFLTAYLITPENNSDLNNSLEEQVKIINRCELVCTLDKYDLEYRVDLYNACRTYLGIMNIKSGIYGTDYTEEINNTINKMKTSIEKTLLYEKENKYVRQDALSFYSTYLDLIVKSSEINNIEEEYIKVFNKLDYNLDNLKENHKYNLVAEEIFSDYSSRVYNKFYEINKIFNNEELEYKLNMLKEKQI